MIIEKYMACRTRGFCELELGWNTIGLCIAANPDATFEMQLNYCQSITVPSEDILPIGNDDLRAVFGMEPFANVHPEGSARSAVTIEHAYCFLPGFTLRPGIRSADPTLLQKDSLYPGDI